MNLFPLIQSWLPGGEGWKGKENVETDYSGLRNVRNNDFLLTIGTFLLRTCGLIINQVRIWHKVHLVKHTQSQLEAQKKRRPVAGCFPSHAIKSQPCFSEIPGASPSSNNRIFSSTRLCLHTQRKLWGCLLSEKQPFSPLAFRTPV